MYRLGCFIVLFLTFALIHSQNVRDSTAILSFVDKIILKANIDTQVESFIVNSANENFTLSTNNQYKLFLSLDYEFIGFSVGVAPKFFPDNNDNALRGESSFNDFQFRFFLGNWVQRIEYSKAQGFYVENTEDFVPNWIEGVDPYLQLPDFTTASWGGSTSYVLNPRFSFRNVVYNTEWQLQSAGSFIPTLHYRYNQVSFSLEDSRFSEDNYDVRFSPDYYYTWVFRKNWFLTSFISPSLGIQFSTSSENQSNEERNTYIPFGLRGGLQLGYSSKKIIFGINFEFNSIYYDEDNQTEIVNDWAYGKLYFGIRLEPSKFVKTLF